ncbi:DUF6531 domain-containing protein, partial [Pseudomonas baetica]|uniref:DUF6531 domain-containing protein n=1 Tax=Pseudomonas baetica TaxID=674054 RepID=UPI003EEFF31B
MDHIARIEQELEHFPNTLTLYRQQLSRWFSQTADRVSHAADMPSLFGMERVIQFGNTTTVVSSGDDDFISTVTQCSKGGPLQIESRFESVSDVPLGKIQVDVIALSSGTSTSITLDENGKGQFSCLAGESYRLRVQNEVTSEQLDELFRSYDGLTQSLERWLRGEWNGVKPQWSQSPLLAVGNGMLAGSWAAIEGVWDGIKLLSDILQDPGQFADRLGSGVEQLKKLAQDMPQAMANLQLLASDEAVLCLLLRCASLWLEMQPPSVIAGETARVVSTLVVELLIDILIAVVLSIAAAGAGITYLTMRLARHGASLINAVTRLVESLFSILNALIGYVDHYKKVAARGVAAGLKKGRMQLRWKARNNTTLKKDEPHDDTPAQAKNPNGDSAEPAALTQTHGCPVSLVTGEELLTLNDGVLDGILPFEFTRLYRTSAVEIDSGLGFGWSHSLSQRLELDGDTVVWIDAENRRTPFPLPSHARPTIHNSLSRAAIYLGDQPEELILALAGESPRFYHFRDGQLSAISDAYGNRLTVQRDLAGRLQRLDNGAGRCLRLRYDRQHLIAVDYQRFQVAASLEQAWHTEQTLVSYRYDARGRLVAATNAAGESERYDYDEQHVILQRQLAGGASFYWEWERAGQAARCIRHWASFAQMDTRYVWDDAGGVTLRHADGSQEHYVHDEQARLVQRVAADGGEQRQAYDAQGRLIAEQDALGAVTEYRYDDVGRLIALIPPEDEPTSYEYRNGFLHARYRGQAKWTYQRNAQGDLTWLIDPDGHSTYHEYDAQGRLVLIRYPDRSLHRFSWNGLGQLLEETLPEGGRRQFAYDALGRRTTTQDEFGAITRHQWDAVGRLLQTTLPS